LTTELEAGSLTSVTETAFRSAAESTPTAGCAAATATATPSSATAKCPTKTTSHLEPLLFVERRMSLYSPRYYPDRAMVQHPVTNLS